MDARLFVTFLIQTKKLTETALQKCLADLKIQKTTLPKVLVHRGYFTPQTLKSAINEFQQLQQKTQAFSASDPTKIQNNTLSENPETTNLQGKILGKYEILSPLAKGGMGMVYKVRHVELRQIYALKMILSGAFANQEDISRFYREAQTTAKLKHPYIVQVLDSGELEGQPYLCMEFVDGTTLDRLIEEKTLSLKRTLRLFQKILEALAYAHNMGIIHRDLKPANIFITSTEDPKIGDFGLAKDLQRNTASQKLTQSGTIFGTPAYMPPEQVQGEILEIDAISDIYSIGACLYQTLTQHCPFEGETIHEVFYKIISEEPLPISDWNRKIPKDVETIVLKALHKDKKKRYQNATDFANDLDLFLSGKSILAKSPSFGEKVKKRIKQHPQLLGFITVLLLTFGSVSFYLQWQTQQQQREKKEAYQHQLIFHQKQFAEWMPKIQVGLTLEKRESFLFEVSKMQEKEIFESLRSLVEEGSRYFIEKSIRDPRREHYYELLTLAFGRLENPKAEALLFDALKQMSQKLSALPKDKPPEADIQYMIALVQALVYSKAPNIAKKVMEIRKQIGEGGIFWNKTHSLLLQLMERDFLGIHENNATAYYERGELNFYAKNFERALADFTKAISLDPHFMEAYQFRGNTKIALNDITGAIEDYNIVLKNNSYLDISYVSRGNAKEKLKDFRGAIEDYTKAIQINPKFFQAYYNRACMEMQINAIPEAIKDFTEAIRLNSQYADAYLNRANLRDQTGDHAGAFSDYTESLRLNPQEITYVNRGFSRGNTGDFKGALEDYAEAIRLNPQFMGTYYNRGALKQKLGDLQGSLNDLNEAIRLDPQYANAYHNRGQIFLQLKKSAEAQKEFQSYLKLTQKDTDANTQALRQKIFQLFPNLRDPK